MRLQPLEPFFGVVIQPFGELIQFVQHAGIVRVELERLAPATARPTPRRRAD